MAGSATADLTRLFTKGRAGNALHRKQCPMWIVLVLLAAVAAFRFYAVWKLEGEDRHSLEGISWGERRDVHGDRSKPATERWDPG